MLYFVLGFVAGAIVGVLYLSVFIHKSIAAVKTEVEKIHDKLRQSGGN